MERLKGMTGLLMLIALSPAFAQDDTHKLQKEVDDLQATVKELQAEVKELKAEQAKPAQAATPPSATYTSAPPATATPAAALTQVPGNQVDVIQLGEAAHTPLPAQQSVSENADSASRIDNEAPPTDPGLKGFVQIPGTETVIKLDGYAKLDTIYDIHSIGTPDFFATSAIPVPAPHDNNGNFNMQARQTRFSLDIRRPAVFDESMRFYVETDLYGGGNGSYGFRLRQAYGQLGNTYAGFGWSAYTDTDALPDTLDFAGPGGAIAPRQAGIHQFFRLGETSSLTLAAEQPSSEVSVYPQVAPDIVVNNLHGTQHAPDVIVAVRTEHNWGHLQLGGVVRQLGYTDGEQSRRVIAGGASLTGSFKVGTFAAYSDLLMFGSNWGKGIARYIADTGGLGLDAVVGPDGKLYTLTGWGAYAAYTHYWSSNWRSNLVYGVARIQHSPWLAPNDYHDTNYGAANLIWTPAPMLTVGLEVLHGRLLEQDTRYNDDTRIQGSLQYSFIK
ncbi:DcaP family trimeric outer membrane transporter [Dyella psychrodurans]|uniref:Porin n=1 Tax=Dyella psychrodurans TaxID=1927960 RepID=A0A370XDR1_9GAMM|nr:DcaP family trimeric outer membrane transporter [Dyella psychrodurans]RDS86371.1 porin [Dyella psychrodurans]